MPWPGGVPVVRPPLHRVGAPRAVGGAGGGRLALVLVAGRVRAARPGAHSTKNKVNIFGSFEVPLLKFSVNILRVSPLFNCLFYESESNRRISIFNVETLVLSVFYKYIIIIVSGIQQA